MCGPGHDKSNCVTSGPCQDKSNRVTCNTWYTLFWLCIVCNASRFILETSAKLMLVWSLDCMSARCCNAHNYQNINGLPRSFSERNEAGKVLIELSCMYMYVTLTSFTETPYFRKESCRCPNEPVIANHMHALPLPYNSRQAYCLGWYQLRLYNVLWKISRENQGNVTCPQM